MYTILDTNVYKLPDGKIWKGVPADLPSSSADLIAKAGKEYPTEWLKEQGWGKKKAPAKKKAAKKPAEKAVKKSDVEDKAVKKDVEDK